MRGAKVKAELFFAVQSDRHGKRQQAAGVARQAGARPNFAPSVTSEQILKWRGEVVCGLCGSVYVVVAEDFAADFHALLVAFAIVHLFFLTQREKFRQRK